MTRSDTAREVTIGMPVYNGAAYLPEAIAALEAQTAGGLNFLVSDNASTDATPAILAEWEQRDRRVRIHRQPHNCGPLGNFDWLARAATTEFFMYAAHDDAWSPNYLEALRAALMARPDAGLAVGRTVLMSEDFSRQTRVIEPDVPDAGSRVGRVQQALRRARSGWFYGVWRRPALLPGLDLVVRTGQPWGHDFVTLLPALLDREFVADGTAQFLQRVTTVSESRWRPKTAASRYACHRGMRTVALSALSASRLTAWERAYLAAFVHKYVGRHTFKLRDIALTLAAERLSAGR